MQPRELHAHRSRGVCSATCLGGVVLVCAAIVWLDRAQMLAAEASPQEMDESSEAAPTEEKQPSGPVCGDGRCEAPEDASSCGDDCPGVTTPAMCGEEHHSDPGGHAVVWGASHKTETAAECCQRCSEHAAQPKNSKKPCNSWVFCNTYPQCWCVSLRMFRTRDQTRAPEPVAAVRNAGRSTLATGIASASVGSSGKRTPAVLSTVSAAASQTSSGESTRTRTRRAKTRTVRRATSACPRTCRGQEASWGRRSTRPSSGSWASTACAPRGASRPSYGARGSRASRTWRAACRLLKSRDESTVTRRLPSRLACCRWYVRV